MAVDLSVFDKQRTLMDQLQLQKEFELKKQLMGIQTAAAVKSLNQDSNALTLKDRIGFQFEQKKLQLEAAKAAQDGLSTNPAGAAIDSTIYEFPQGDLMNAVMMQESGGNPNAVSPKGAQGLMQIMPDTARDPGYGVQPLQGWDGQNPMSAPQAEQMRFAKDYMQAMLLKNGGDQKLALASYNAGPGAVEKYGGIPPYKETQDYVKKISGSMSPQGAKPLYQKGLPVTTGLPSGYQLGVTPDGQQIALRIPGVEKEIKPLTESQDKTALFADRLREANPIIDKKASANTTGQQILGSVPGAGNYLVSSDYQQLDQAKRNFINATLRRESGAVIGQDEFDNANKQYFPQPGDSADTIKQKAANRQTVINGFARGAGEQYQAEFLQAPTKAAESGAFQATPSGVKYRIIE